MFDLRSARASGAYEAARVRALWHKGVLKLFDGSGLVLTARAMEPQPLPGRRSAWRTTTERGELVLRGRCMTCGGLRWLRLMRKSGDELWNG